MGQVLQKESSSQKPLSIKELADKIKNGQLKNIIVMIGAGISTSAGILDFRTPSVGLYDKLQQYDLPTPQSIFTLDYFRQKPQAFYMLAKDLYPGKYKPSDAHRFIKLLADKKILLRCYTQNIDGLEELAGIPSNLIVQAHGGFGSAHCIDCKKPQDVDLMKRACEEGKVLHCLSCGGLTKPDIVFFGEPLPSDFAHCIQKDFPRCDCLIVMGTSLKVFPFAGLVGEVWDHVPRLLINREMCGTEINGGFLFEQPNNRRDIFMQGDCDSNANILAKLITQ